MPIAVPPQVDLGDQDVGLAQPVRILTDHHGVAAEFLAQRHRNGVLQLGAAHLEVSPELDGLRGERGHQFGHRQLQSVHGELEGDLESGGIHVIGALS